MKYDGIFIGINYNSTKESLNWISSVRKVTAQNNILIIIVDTSAELLDSELEEKVRDIDEKIIYINAKENLGYFGGARLAVELVIANAYEYEFLIVSNVDLTFTSKDIVSKILSNTKSDIGVISPSIIVNNKDINPYRIKRMDYSQMKRRLLYLKHPKLQGIVDFFRRIRKQSRNNISYPEGTEMYMTYGACFIFTKHYFSNGGNINLPLFLYGEEPYVAEQCKNLNLKTIYVPSIKINDIGHVSTGSIPSKKQCEYLIDATNYCIRNFYPR